MIYHVFANRSNVGDWLAARAIQRLVALPVVELLCDEPFVPATIDELSRATERDLVVIGGGGLFMDYFQPFWTGFEPLSKRLRFCIWGVGCCDMKRSPSRPDLGLIEMVVRRSQLAVVRDELTRRMLPDCALPAPVGCPSMTIVEDRPLGRGLLHVDALDNVGDRAYQMMTTVAQDFSLATGRTFGAINNEIPAGSEHRLRTTLESYASADLILTGRLHGCILGRAMGRRILAVSGDWKIESFMDAAGLSEWVVGPDVHQERLRAKLFDLADQPSPGTFLAQTRTANEHLAERVRGMANTK